MLTLSLKRPNFFNQKLHDYCLKSTNKLIKKKIMNYDEERKINKNSLVLQDGFPSEPNNNHIITVVCFLSVSSLLYYFYNSKR